MTNQQIEQLMVQLREETAAELGITLGADITSRMNGAVGGRVTQKLIELGKQSLLEQSQPVMMNQTTQQQNQNQFH